ncbi:hypothetical protein Hanom_Chr13g01184451 [Helianthus anomalus]
MSPLLIWANPNRWMMIRIVWLGFNMGHRVRIGPIATTYWVSPLLILFLVVI